MYAIPTGLPMSLASQSQTPVLPLRDVVVYPHMAIPLFVGREKSAEARSIVWAATGTARVRAAVAEAGYAATTA